MKFTFPPTKLLEPAAAWNQWTWQMKNALTTADEFRRWFELTPEEEQGFCFSDQVFKIAVTPYYASLGLENQAIRRIFMPHALEGELGSQAQQDPLAEEVHNPAPAIIHRYSDRVLFLVTDTCSVYCRFCTRKRFTGKEQGKIRSSEYSRALYYIRSHPGIREVILSGGDPLTLSNGVLNKILGDLRAISHVEIIRVGSRMPVVCPMRVDVELARVLRAHAPVFLMSHFSHPRELTLEAAAALSCLVDHGVPVFNQMVLLNGVNNDAALIQALSRRLLYLRVKPYYMFQCDPSRGSDHLRTPVAVGERIMGELWGHMSGLAMPQFSLDIPSGAGKTTLVPDFMVEREPGVRRFVGWDGRSGEYRDPLGPVLVPPDAAVYRDEWDNLKTAKATGDAEASVAKRIDTMISTN